MRFNFFFFFYNFQHLRTFSRTSAIVSRCVKSFFDFFSRRPRQKGFPCNFSLELSAKNHEERGKDVGSKGEDERQEEINRWSENRLLRFTCLEEVGRGIWFGRVDTYIWLCSLHNALSLSESLTVANVTYVRKLIITCLNTPIYLQHICVQTNILRLVA